MSFIDKLFAPKVTTTQSRNPYGETGGSTQSDTRNLSDTTSTTGSTTGSRDALTTSLTGQTGTGRSLSGLADQSLLGGVQSFARNFDTGAASASGDALRTAGLNLLSNPQAGSAAQRRATIEDFYSNAARTGHSANLAGRGGSSDYAERMRIQREQALARGLADADSSARLANLAAAQSLIGQGNTAGLNAASQFGSFLANTPFQKVQETQQQQDTTGRTAVGETTAQNTQQEAVRNLVDELLRERSYNKEGFQTQTTHTQGPSRFQAISDALRTLAGGALAVSDADKYGPSFAGFPPAGGGAAGAV